MRTSPPTSCGWEEHLVNVRESVEGEGPVRVGSSRRAARCTSADREARGRASPVRCARASAGLFGPGDRPGALGPATNGMNFYGSMSSLSLCRPAMRPALSMSKRFVASGGELRLENSSTRCSPATGTTHRCTQVARRPRSIVRSDRRRRRDGRRCPHNWSGLVRTHILLLRRPRSQGRSSPRHTRSECRGTCTRRRRTSRCRGRRTFRSSLDRSSGPRAGHHTR